MGCPSDASIWAPIGRTTWSTGPGRKISEITCCTPSELRTIRTDTSPEVHLNYDPTASHEAVNAAAEACGDPKEHPPFRRYARVFLAADAAETWAPKGKTAPGEKQTPGTD